MLRANFRRSNYRGRFKKNTERYLFIFPFLPYLPTSILLKGKSTATLGRYSTSEFGKLCKIAVQVRTCSWFILHF